MKNSLIYLSYFLNGETPLYGGEKGIVVKPERAIANGDTANTKRLILHNHSGTHIDFPNHFYEDGKVSHNYEPSFWIFNSPFLINVDAGFDELIGLDDSAVNLIPEETDFLIIKTGFGQHRGDEKYWKHNPGLVPEVASGLRIRCPQLRVVGMDFISLTSFQNREIGRTAHREFLKDPAILLVEDMDLSKLLESPKAIFCFPLLVDDIDGAPVTIIAEQSC